MRRRHRSSGFSLVELLVALLMGSVISGALVGLFVSQINFYREDDAAREARSGARAALNVMLSDLRMVEVRGGVTAAASRDLTLRLPYRFGIVCSSAAGATDVSLFPADATTVATAGFSGWASRPGTGIWVYRDGAATLTSPGTASCVAASVATLAGGEVIRITPGAAGLTAGTPVMLYQRIRYRFAASASIPGKDALYRTVVATGLDEELVAPFSGTARFRFYTNANWTAAQDAPPADLSTLVGLEIHMDAESVSPVPATGEPEAYEVVSSMYFMNVPE